MGCTQGRAARSKNVYTPTRFDSDAATQSGHDTKPRKNSDGKKQTRAADALFAEAQSTSLGDASLLFREEFQYFDFDGDGVISFEDMVCALQSLGLGQQSLCSDSRPSPISWDGYLQWRTHLLRDPKFCEDLHAVFFVADMTYDGAVTEEDLILFTNEWQPRPPQEEIEKLVQAFRSMLTGSVQQSQFEDMMFGKNSAFSKRKFPRRLACRWRCYCLVVMRGLFS